MPDTVTCKIEGLENVSQRLEELAKGKATEAIRTALRAGGDVIQSAVAERTPVQSGLLLENITSTEVESAKAQQGAVVIGFGKQGYIARFVEFGHIVANVKREGKLHHVPANPFMRQAMDTCHDAAVEAFAAALKQAIEAS